MGRIARGRLSVNMFVLLGLAWLVFLGRAVFSYLSRRSGPPVSSLFGALPRRGSSGPSVVQPYGAYAPGVQQRPNYGSVSRSNLRRRRDVLVVLLGLCVASLLPALLVGGPFLVFVHVMADVTLLAYVAALLSIKNRRHPRPALRDVSVGRHRSIGHHRSIGRHRSIGHEGFVDHQVSVARVPRHRY
jgi:hypothetical protein